MLKGAEREEVNCTKGLDAVPSAEDIFGLLRDISNSKYSGSYCRKDIFFPESCFMCQCLLKQPVPGVIGCIRESTDDIEVKA